MFKKIVERIAYTIKYHLSYDFRKTEDDLEVYELYNLIQSTPDGKEKEKYRQRLQRLEDKSPFATSARRKI